ncbi:hypothetical protein F8203_gp131 [Heliothis virescens ascovirus 3f]|uniref:Uncharacterized protein n=1 Tax=Heliothis virescens ascovirus 3f TaxID=328614 RepID=A0A171PVL9_9VIRU|nr:hypothetical protein F8203_gp131 [Heliothis virescens ascovirus 3f]AJP09097.1 hypothetical protein [Heliothis virescens ascovirus 3f]
MSNLKRTAPSIKRSLKRIKQHDYDYKCKYYQEAHLYHVKFREMYRELPVWEIGLHNFAKCAGRLNDVVTTLSKIITRLDWCHTKMYNRDHHEVLRVLIGLVLKASSATSCGFISRDDYSAWLMVELFIENTWRGYACISNKKFANYETKHRFHEDISPYGVDGDDGDYDASLEHSTVRIFSSDDFRVVVDIDIKRGVTMIGTINTTSVLKDDKTDTVALKLPVCGNVMHFVNEHLNMMATALCHKYPRDIVRDFLPNDYDGDEDDFDSLVECYKIFVHSLQGYCERTKKFSISFI